LQPIIGDAISRYLGDLQVQHRGFAHEIDSQAVAGADHRGGKSAKLELSAGTYKPILQQQQGGQRCWTEAFVRK
jgi:hypothetical protein